MGTRQVTEGLLGWGALGSAWRRDVPASSFTNLRGRWSQAKISCFTVPANVRSPARGSTNRGQTRVASSRSVEVKQAASPPGPDATERAGPLRAGPRSVSGVGGGVVVPCPNPNPKGLGEWDMGQWDIGGGWAGGRLDRLYPL